MWIVSMGPTGYVAISILSLDQLILDKKIAASYYLLFIELNGKRAKHQRVHQQTGDIDPT